MPDAFDASAPADTSDPAATDSNFDAIHAALMETQRGRLFLAEYARRCRAAETGNLAAALARLEARLPASPAAAPASPTIPPALVADSLGRIEAAVNDLAGRHAVAGMAEVPEALERIESLLAEERAPFALTGLMEDLVAAVARIETALAHRAEPDPSAADETAALRDAVAMLTHSVAPIETGVSALMAPGAADAAGAESSVAAEPRPAVRADGHDADGDDDAEPTWAAASPADAAVVNAEQDLTAAPDALPGEPEGLLIEAQNLLVEVQKLARAVDADDEAEHQERDADAIEADLASQQPEPLPPLDFESPAAAAEAADPEADGPVAPTLLAGHLTDLVFVAVSSATERSVRSDDDETAAAAGTVDLLPQPEPEIRAAEDADAEALASAQPAEPADPASALAMPEPVADLPAADEPSTAEASEPSGTEPNRAAAAEELPTWLVGDLSEVSFAPAETSADRSFVTDDEKTAPAATETVEFLPQPEPEIRAAEDAEAAASSGQPAEPADPASALATAATVPDLPASVESSAAEETEPTGREPNKAAAADELPTWLVGDLSEVSFTPAETSAERSLATDDEKTAQAATDSSDLLPVPTPAVSAPDSAEPDASPAATAGADTLDTATPDTIEADAAEAVEAETAEVVETIEAERTVDAAEAGAEADATAPAAPGLPDAMGQLPSWLAGNPADASFAEAAPSGERSIAPDDGKSAATPSDSALLLPEPALEVGGLKLADIDPQSDTLPATEAADTAEPTADADAEPRQATGLPPDWRPPAEPEEPAHTAELRSRTAINDPLALATLTDDEKIALFS